MPSKKVQQILLIDVESTAWSGNPPDGEYSDIIEIGLVVVDIATLAVTKKDDWFVYPTTSHISPFCTALTTIDDALLAAQPSVRNFRAAVQDLEITYHSKDCVFASYGDYDRLQFERQCQREHIDYPFGRRHLNIKTLLMLAYGWPQELGMAQALDTLGIQLTGQHHRAGDDAKNIANMLIYTLQHSRKV